jgi:sugar porter (SP) family MFS transporter
MYFVALVASLGGFQFGYEVGILESIKSFTAFKMDFSKFYNKTLIIDNDFGVNENGEGVMLKLKYEEKPMQSSLMVTMFCIGCVVGTLVVPTVCDFFGRKRSILFGAAIFGFGSLFAGITIGDTLFFFSRVIMGIGIGILSTTCPMYIAETSPAEKRGKLITFYQLMITIGIFSAYIVRIITEFFLRNDRNVQWRVILGIQVVPGFLLLIMMFFLPYSPRYYIWQERDDEALRIVSKLRGMSSTRDPEIQTEFQNMKKSLEIERHEYSTGFSELFKKSIIKRVIIVMMLQIFQQLTGINVILSSKIFDGTQISYRFLTDDITTTFGFINVFCNVIGTIPTLWLIEKFGRKAVLIFGSITMTISLGVSAVFSKLKANNENKEIYSWVYIICIFAFVISFAASWGPAVWVYQNEVFPMRVRSLATSLCCLVNWASFGIIVTIYSIIIESSNSKEKDVYANSFFAICCFISLFFVIFFVRETKDTPLEEVDNIFGNKEKSKQK